MYLISRFSRLWVNREINWRPTIKTLAKFDALSLYSRLSLNGHLYKTDASVKRTLRVGPCLSLLPSFDSLQDGHLVPVPKVSVSRESWLYCPI